MTAETIFKAAKAKFDYVTDQALHGVIEYWANITELQALYEKTGLIEGDCEDFAAWCVHQLRAEDLPARYVLCQCENGAWHCVAETSGLILDNRQDFVARKDLLPYTWHSISGYSAGDPWHLIV